MMKNEENGQLSCGIYSSPAAARSPLQGWVGDRSIKELKVYIYISVTVAIIYLFTACIRIYSTKIEFVKVEQGLGHLN